MLSITFQIDGRRGYVNKGHVQEQRVYKKDLQFTIPTEFFKGPEEVVKEKEENAEKPRENEILKNESTDKTQFQPNTNIDKTEQLEDQQFETKNPELQNPAIEVKIRIELSQSKYFPECTATLVHKCVNVS